MSKLATRIYNRYFAPKQQPLQKRRYAAGRMTRQNRDWTTVPFTANWTIRESSRIVRARAREMAANAPHFNKFLRMAERNVVGADGVQLQCTAMLGSSKTRRPNTKLNSTVEQAFWEWSFKENCTVSGKMCFVEAQKLFLRHYLRDGEVIVQHMTADNPFGYALKFWNVDWLDDTFDDVLPNGNRVIMSVEVDDNYKPQAYWFTMPTSEMAFARTNERKRIRVPASEIIHRYEITEDESQVRGVTRFIASIVQGKDFHEYVGGVVQSARVQSHVFGFIETVEGEEVQFDGAEDAEGRTKPLDIDVSPLSINALNPGEKFTQLDPKQPTQNHAQFHDKMLLDVAAGLDVPGFSLAGDLSAVNYSSARVGLGDERDMWRGLQAVVADFCRDVYHRWLDAAWLSGQLSISAQDRDQLRNPSWKPRGWRFVDPQKETQANIDAIAGNLATYRSTLADQGIDLEEFLAEKQAEMDLFKQYGIEYASPQLSPKGNLATEPEPNAAEGNSTDTSGDAPNPAKRELANGHGYELLDN